jgi:hypothetical protein
MKSEIELARARRARTEELAEAARYAHEQAALYRARTYGPKVTSPARLRKLERETELADLRLQLAQGARVPKSADVEPPRAGFRGETDDGIPFE